MNQLIPNELMLYLLNQFKLPWNGLHGLQHWMRVHDNGLWIATKYFTQGSYQYYFLVDGEKVIDIENTKKLWDLKRGQVSFIIIE